MSEQDHEHDGPTAVGEQPRGRRTTRRSRVVAVLAGAALATGALAGAPNGALPVVPSAAENAHAVTVLNLKVRWCSMITGRCTSYRQVNPPYNPSVGTAYRTYWTFSSFLPW